jgi:transcriptional regulator with XRE-family HTH domain
MIAPAKYDVGRTPHVADVFQSLRTAAATGRPVSVPTQPRHPTPTGVVPSGFSVRVPQALLGSHSVFGAVLGTGIPRTQGLFTDQYRVVLLTLAKSFGEVAAPVVQARTTEPLGALLDRLRTSSGLPAAEIARMVGIQRRQLYNLVDGGKTTPDREQRIRSIARVVDVLLERLVVPSMVRSSLLAPVGPDLRSFVDLATEGVAVAAAERLLVDYLDKMNDAPRQYIQTPRRARAQEKEAAKAIKDTSDISPDRR